MPSLAHASAEELARASALHDAQSVIAREHGFPSWKALLETVEERSLEFHAAIDEFILAATAGRTDRARRLLALHPGMARASFVAALLLGALVIGAGSIGVLTLQSLLAAGCSKVFVTDVDADRLNLAGQLGATETLLSDDSLQSKILQHTNNQGVDVALECVGRSETIAAAIDATRKGGTVVLVGNITPNVNLPLQKVVSRQIRLQGSCASAGEYPRAIELMASGKILVKPLISAIVPLEQGASWFERLYHREPKLLKVVLTPGQLHDH